MGVPHGIQGRRKKQSPMQQACPRMTTYGEVALSQQRATRADDERLERGSSKEVLLPRVRKRITGIGGCTIKVPLRLDHACMVTRLDEFVVVFGHCRRLPTTVRTFL